MLFSALFYINRDTQVKLCLEHLGSAVPRNSVREKAFTHIRRLPESLLRSDTLGCLIINVCALARVQDQGVAAVPQAQLGDSGRLSLNVLREVCSFLPPIHLLVHLYPIPRLPEIKHSFSSLNVRVRVHSPIKQSHLH